MLTLFRFLFATATISLWSLRRNLCWFQATFHWSACCWRSRAPLRNPISFIAYIPSSGCRDLPSLLFGRFWSLFCHTARKIYHVEMRDAVKLIAFWRVLEEDRLRATQPDPRDTTWFSWPAVNSCVTAWPRFKGDYDACLLSITFCGHCFYLAILPTKMIDKNCVKASITKTVKRPVNSWNVSAYQKQWIFFQLTYLTKLQRIIKKKTKNMMEDRKSVV